jgi:hypothetical protein
MSIDQAEDCFRVRVAIAEDRPLLQAILDASLGESNARVYGLAADELLKQNRVYLAFFEGKPTACVMATLTEPMVLHCLHVVFGARRRGHAGALLTSAIRQMDEDAPAAFWTAVDPRRRSGVERCLSLGFVQLHVDFADMSESLSEMCVMLRPAPTIRSNRNEDHILGHEIP